MRERGSVLGIRLLLFVATMFGRAPMRFVVWWVASYYTLFSSVTRRTTKELFGRLGIRTGFAATHRRVFRFAQCAADAALFLQGKTSYFRITRNGSQHLSKLHGRGCGAVLLGAHVGSFYALRMQGGREDLRLYPVVYMRNARRFNQVLKSIDPRSQTQLIEMNDDNQVDFMLRIREKVELGGLIAILADRVSPGGKTVSVDFLGGRARLPAGPYVLASVLRCPVYVTVGIYRGGNHYDLFCEPFAEQVVLPRKHRDAAIQQYAQQYADRVAHYCRDAPDNWFNFFDFWESSGGSPGSEGQNGNPGTQSGNAGETK